MTTVYEYDHLPGIPCLPYIQNRIAYGAVGSLDVEEISWSDDVAVLRVSWKVPLDPVQKSALDVVVSDSAGKTQVPKTRQEIVNDVFWACYQDQAQLGRLLQAFDAMPSMALALDNFNYPLARLRVAVCFSEGLITEADRDLLLSKIPENEFELS